MRQLRRRKNVTSYSLTGHYILLYAHKHIYNECSQDQDAAAWVQWQTDLWWGTHPGIQRRDPGQSASPGIRQLVGGPVLFQGKLTRHPHYSLFHLLLQIVHPPVNQRSSYYHNKRLYFLYSQSTPCFNIILAFFLIISKHIFDHSWWSSRGLSDSL